jgi:hypothetical protein
MRELLAVLLDESANYGPKRDHPDSNEWKSIPQMALDFRGEFDANFYPARFTS